METLSLEPSVKQLMVVQTGIWLLGHGQQYGCCPGRWSCSSRQP